jgi:peptidoglycan-associated lipoprotein
MKRRCVPNILIIIVTVVSGGFYGVCPKHSISMLAITLGLLVVSGCGGKSARYGANSEGDGMNSSPNEHEPVLAEVSSSANGSGKESEVHGGAVDGTNPHLRSRESNNEKAGKGLSSPPMAQEAMGGIAKPFVGSNYGDNYAGGDGAGPNYGPLMGFGNELAPTNNLDPESWANAYLGGGQSSPDFYGDPSQAGSVPRDPATSGETPETWAEKYAKEYGGLSLEHVNPDMSIAHTQAPEAGGSVGIGRINDDELIVESNFGGDRGMDQGNVQDIYFAFDSWNISGEAARFLEEGARWLHANPRNVLTIEGHCDQRGTQDYNLVLGQKRAEAAREYLVNLGVQSGRIKIVSYGKERPFCQYDSEDCFQENRRSHMVVRVKE